jgi:Ycf66 protein N-terminus
MLAYILAVLVGTGSVGLYISAFFFPEIHRKQDFIWSGVGFLYALALWIYARQETGGILVGQTASVALLGWLSWQTLKLRRQLIPVNQQTPIPTASKLKEQLGLKQPAPKTAKPTAKTPTPAKTITPAAAPPTKIPTIQPPVSQEAVPVERNIPEPVQQISQPLSPDPVVEEEAWIKLEVKPASAPSKPLGNAVQPPTVSNSEPAQSEVIIPETISANVPTEIVQNTAELDSEDRA